MKRSTLSRLAGIAALVLGGFALGMGSAAADPVADFYKGKQLNWILSAGAGGGYSSYALTFAPYSSTALWTREP